MPLFRKSSRSDLNYKRPPIRQSNGVYGYDGRQAKSRLNLLKYAKPVGWCLCLTLSLSIMMSAVSTVLYVNCANPGGFEVIPKSRQLCHDLYQLVQTGRIPPLTWDYKASFNESVRIFRESSTATYERIKSFNLVSLQNAVTSAVIVCRDAVVEFCTRVYQHVVQMNHVAMKWLRGLVDVATEYVAWSFQRFIQIVSENFHWIKGSVANVIQHFPTYLEKMKSVIAK